MHRANREMQRRVAATFVDWGIPTSEAILAAKEAEVDIPIIASGGLRNGLDLAKCIALGATLGGMANPFLKAAVNSLKTVLDEILVEAKKLSGVIEDKQAVLRVHPDVAKELKSTKNTYLEEIEETLGVPVMVTGDPELHHEKFDLS